MIPSPAKCWLSAVIALAALSLSACNGDSQSPQASGGLQSPSSLQSSPKLRVLSDRADLINDNDALVEVLAPVDAAVSVTRNGEDVSDQFERTGDGKLLGLVSGLKLGMNNITAHLPGGDATAQIINHPNGGPVFSGPQLQPWTCRNDAAVDAKCNQPPEYSFFYKSTDPTQSGLQPYDPNNPPSDVATTTTENGTTVPFIVRVETGYQDRDQYQIATLFQPDMSWSAAAPQPQFNHKMLVNHGVSCGVDYQTGTAPSVISYNPADVTGAGIPAVGGDATEYALGQGFAVMSTALDFSGHNCNLALQAESLVMAKERVVEQYGVLRYTIGEGCSGGSLAQQWIANAYPGIYQGLLPTCSFPDAWSTATQFLDYHLTLDYFTDQSQWGQGVVWSPTQMADVQGHATIVNSEVSDQAQFHVAVPTDSCSGISDEQRYDPDTNPGGVRCDIQDAAINLFGLRPPERWGPQEKQVGHGFAGVPLDNVGVQYGLEVLQRGTITPAQFIDLNQKIGGVDYDANIVPERTVATEPTLSNAYRTGMANEGNNLDRAAIIDCRGPDPAAFHDAYRAFAMRARLDREHGNHDNQLIWEGPVEIIGDTACGLNSLKAMNRWLAAVEQDNSDMPLAQKLTANKPADLADRCYDGAGHKLTDDLCPETSVPGTSPSLNVGVVPIYGTPRTVAGDSITTDNNKCQLKPLNRNDDYGPVPFTDAQWQQMQTIFPDGVCDFSKPGVSQQPTVAWQSYQQADGSVIYGGTQMSAAPAHSGGGWAAPAFALFGSHPDGSGSP